MYTNNAYLNNSTIDRKDKSKPLVVTMCGTYKLYTCPKLPTWRPRGRVDFQLIFIAAGKAHFHFNNDEEETIVHAGHMVLYRPKEPQKYEYYAKDQTEVYWVHFTGNNVKNFLRRYGIADDTRIIYTGISIEYKNLFMSMIEELNLQRIDYEEMLINYFTILLISLHRIALQKPRKKNLQNMNDMEQAAQYFRMHYNKPISIEDYAVSHNMSISWFIQNFRQYANTTPAQYVQSLRLTNAKMLLETTNYNITEIANLVGYENPLYFSRFFRKQCGISPSQFRKQLVPNAESCPK